MTFPSDFHFIRPAWLILIPGIVWVWWRVRTLQDPLRGWRAVMDRELLAAVTVGLTPHSDNRNRVPSSAWRAASLLTAWLLAVLALAGPTWRPEPSPFADDPVPVMLVLKAGDTMDLADLAPSRIERARLKITDFATERKGQPLGLVAYAGSAHLVLPPTRDTSVVAAMAAEISPAVMPEPGDDLAKSLTIAAQTLGGRGGSLVVLADTVPAGSEPALRQFRSANRLPVHFLAIARAGTPELAAVETAASALGADVTVMAADSSDIGNLVRRIARAHVAVAADGQGTHWAEAGWWLLPALAVLSLSGFRRVGNTTLPETVS